MSAEGEEALPPGWAWATVGEVGVVQLGRQRAPEHHRGPHMRKYLRVANVFEDAIDTRDVMEMNFSPDEFEQFRLEAGDILLNEGQSRELVGRPAMFRGEVDECCFTNSLVRFRAGECVVPMFALYLFRHWLRDGTFMGIANITTNIAHLGAGRFAALSIPVPPLAEQRRIVAALDEMLGRVRAARASLDEASLLLERARQAVLAATFAPKDHPFSATSAPTDSSVWEERRLEEIVVDGAPICYGIVLPGPEVPDGVPYLRQQDIADGSIDFTEIKHTSREIAQQHRRSELAEGDVLLCIIRNLRVATVPRALIGANLTQGTVRIRVNRTIAVPEFIALYLRGPRAQTWMKQRYFGMAMPRINVKDARVIPVPLPPLAEQHEIVRRVDAALAKLDAAAAAVEETRARLDAIERAVLARAFRGELVEQDADDEPAAEMLARLRASRAEAPTKRGRRVAKA